jgi:hypothetical protein
MKISVFAVDLAKSKFQIHGFDSKSRVRTAHAWRLPFHGVNASVVRCAGRVPPEAERVTLLRS